MPARGGRGTAGRIYFASTRSGEFQIWKTRADSPNADAAAIQITRQGGIEAEESPDGRYLYHAKRLHPGIWRLPLGGRSRSGRSGSSTSAARDVGPCDPWDPRAGRGLGVLRRSGSSIRHAAHVRGPGVAGRLGIRPVGGALAVSPDGQWAVVTVERVVESDIMLVEGFR